MLWVSSTTEYKEGIGGKRLFTQGKTVRRIFGRDKSTGITLGSEGVVAVLERTLRRTQIKTGLQRKGKSVTK